MPQVGRLAVHGHGGPFSSLVNKDGNKARQARWMQLPPATPVASHHAMACCSWALPTPNSVDWSVQPQRIFFIFNTFLKLFLILAPKLFLFYT
jgi:hypothetical protein